MEKRLERFFGKEVWVFDLETDGLQNEVTKIHVLSFKRFGDAHKKYSTSNAESMKKFFSQDFIFVGHKISLFDRYVVQKILGIQIPYKSILDTLVLSWYLYEERLRHSMGSYEEEMGFKKVEVAEEEWKIGNKELMTERCEMDVVINEKMLLNFMDLYFKIYDEDPLAKSFITYLHFKVDCIYEQLWEKVGFDRGLCESTLETLEEQFNSAKDKLEKVLPPIDKVAKRTQPKNIFKKDGNPSVAGQRWIDFCEKANVDIDFEGEIIEVVGQDKPNAGSPKQVKDYLFSLGWKPETFRFDRNKETGETRQIEQVNNPHKKGEVCISIQRLFKDNPELVNLEGMGILKHRIGVLKGFLKNQHNEMLVGDMGGFTKTLRLKHRVLVNLPQPRELYAENIRACLIPKDKDNILIGSDLSSIEDVTKRHYIYDYDREYVEEQMSKDFDAHIDIAWRAGLVTEEQKDKFFYNKGQDIDNGDFLKAERDAAKTVNFSATYGVGAKTLARTMGVTEKRAKKIIDAYWERNWSVERFAEDLETKVVEGKTWIKCPLNKFWLYLQNDKDKFSAVNQHTGQYILDMYIYLMRQEQIKMWLQYHDEWNSDIPKARVKEVRAIKEEAMEKLNKMMGLNLRIEANFSVGENYSLI